MSLQVAIDRPPRCRGRLVGTVAAAAARVLLRFRAPHDVGPILHRLQRRAPRPATYAEALVAVTLMKRVSMAAAAGRNPIRTSVAVTLVCLMRGTSVRWCLGLRTPPVQRHAWVEAEGRPVGERVDVRAAYPTLLASSDAPVPV